MAEIRKHKPSKSAIAQALEAAMGASVKPVAPGAKPEPGEQKPKSGKPAQAHHVRPSAAAPTKATFDGLPAGAWTTINPGIVPVVPKASDADDDVDDGDDRGDGGRDTASRM